MELNAWTKHLHGIYDHAVSLYRSGNRDLGSYFSDEEKGFLASIGLRPIHVYDFAEDSVGTDDLDWETFLLVAAVRRDYFLYMQGGRANPAEIDAADLHPKSAEIDGIRWLPRMIQKAQNFIEGASCRDIMYCCGGDRQFLRNHGIHPADFLREVWAARGDEGKVLAFVKREAR